MAERVRVVVAAGRDDDGPAAVDDRFADRDPVETDGGVLARLSERLPVRLDPGRRPALAIAVVVVLVAVATGLWVMSSRPRSMPVSAAAPTVAGASPLVPSGHSGASSPSGSSRPAAASSSTTEVVVDVAGKVRRPGVYRLPPGSRVGDAVTAAGGALRGVDLSSVNLAAILADGQQIAVGKPGAAPPAAPASGGGTGPAASSGGAAGGLINLNSATLDQLEGLPGIGPALGQRILDYRTEHGSFSSVDQLDDVSGIGTVTFERLKKLVTV